MKTGVEQEVLEQDRFPQMLREQLNEYDHVLTATRLVVAEELFHYGDYIDAVSLFLLIRKRNQSPSVSISCVYTTLRILLEIGLVEVRQEGREKLFKMIRA